MSILKLKPAYKNYLWGGNKLIKEYGMEYANEKLAEAWVLSAHKDGQSIISEGVYEGCTLQQYIEQEGFAVLGTHCKRFREFPIIIKLIDAKENLSIQVHPNNRYALEHEGEFGKTEMWYVLAAEPQSVLYYGFKREISREEFVERIENHKLIEVMNAVEVQKGDTLFIESGTLHAIGKGIVVAEIQQSSKVTYRVYDYGRLDDKGRQRELHIDKALEVTNRIPIKRVSSDPHVADCDYFTVDKLNLDGKLTYRTQGIIDETSFMSILILDGEGIINCAGEKLNYKKGESFFISANSGDWQIEGRCEALITTVKAKENPIRVGVNIGSSEIQIGIVNANNELLKVKSYVLNSKNRATKIIRETAQNILKLLKENDIALEDCVGVGVGVAGTIDRNKGRVIYSNNLGWRNVNLESLLNKMIPCPVRIANNANCAALGEAIAGAGRKHKDLVMLTIGNGVGGGVIMDGKVFEGGKLGGAEVGHQVIEFNGRLCTCGRHGCLEAYVSIPGLLKTVGKNLTLKEIFEEEGMQEILTEYTNKLGQGIVNIVNIFRPQLILIGGKLSPYAYKLIDRLQKIMIEECFGGESSSMLIPEIAIAELGSNAGIIGAANL